MGKIKMSIKSIYLIIFFSLFIFSFIFLSVLDKKATPAIMAYAEVNTKKIAIEVLRNAGLKEVNKKIKNTELFTVTNNGMGEMESIDFNTPEINELLIVVAKAVRKKLMEIESGNFKLNGYYSELSNQKLSKKGIIYEVPIGVMFGNSFLMNVGPKIPVKITYAGNVGVDVKTRIKSYGINSAMIEIFILVEATQRMILPFQSKDIKISSEVPIVMKVVKGAVPNYLSGSTNGYSYQLPLE